MAQSLDARPVAERYTRFSADHARGRSPAYAELTARIAADAQVIARIADLPPGNKQQPNLLLGAVRYLQGPIEPWPRFRTWLLENWDRVRQVMLERHTQTNEVARCATLLPALAALPGPLALIEVGASAGLCLFPDRYRYTYDGRPPLGPEDSPLTLACSTGGPVPLPRQVPRIVWRAGIDLNPLDAGDEDDVRWLEALIWPGPGARERGRRLRAAARVVGQDPPQIVRGDLVECLPRLAAQAPPEATLVIFHTAVLVYLSMGERERFADLVAGLPGHWLSNEEGAVLPWQGGPRPADPHLFTLALDGRPIAHTSPHGQSVHWLQAGGGQGGAR